MRQHVILFTLLALPGAAAAHTADGHGNGFAAGVLHPLTGADHLAMLAGLGLVAAMMPRARGMALSAVFLAGLAVGGGLGVAGLAVPFVEVAIALSVVATGLALAMARPLALPLAGVAAGGFALFHGLAHGTEIVPGAHVLPHLAGVLAGSAAAVVAVAFVGGAARHAAPGVGAVGGRVLGGALAMAGMAFAAGTL